MLFRWPPSLPRRLNHSTSYPSTAYRNCPASLAGKIPLFSKVIHRLQLVRDFRRDTLGSGVCRVVAMIAWRDVANVWPESAEAKRSDSLDDSGGRRENRSNLALICTSIDVNIARREKFHVRAFSVPRLFDSPYEQLVLAD